MNGVTGDLAIQDPFARLNIFIAILDSAPCGLSLAESRCLHRRCALFSVGVHDFVVRRDRYTRWIGQVTPASPGVTAFDFWRAVSLLLLRPTGAESHRVGPR